MAENPKHLGPCDRRHSLIRPLPPTAYAGVGHFCLCGGGHLRIPGSNEPSISLYKRIKISLFLLHIFWKKIKLIDFDSMIDVIVNSLDIDPHLRL